ncbi:MAG: hypothetical protein D6769_01400 [Methanobacteriota archaeon]|nr:MAG: hypothetical protein D6769_01400 [Euryarchaeota archaeon]
MVSSSVLKVYSSYKNSMATDDDLYNELAMAVKERRREDAYYLSRAIYARGRDEIKEETSKLLVRNDMKDLVPYTYLKEMKNNPSRFMREE